MGGKGRSQKKKEYLTKVVWLSLDTGGVADILAFPN
jgi:hypothetical protein